AAARKTSSATPYRPCTSRYAITGSRTSLTSVIRLGTLSMPGSIMTEESEVSLHLHLWCQMHRNGAARDAPRRFGRFQAVDPWHRLCSKVSSRERWIRGGRRMYDEMYQ